jgi:hypothetical protein
MRDDFGLVTTSLSIPAEDEQDFYFEVEIVDGGSKSIIGLGLHPPGIVSGMIGWQANSYGYHADDGSLRNGLPQLSHVTSHRGSTGDVLGCGWKKDSGIVYFTKNGTVIGSFGCSIKSQMHAVVTGSDMAAVRVNLGQYPFVLANRAEINRDYLVKFGSIIIEDQATTKRRGKGWLLFIFCACCVVRVCAYVALESHHIIGWIDDNPSNGIWDVTDLEAKHASRLEQSQLVYELVRLLFVPNHSPAAGSLITPAVVALFQQTPFLSHLRAQLSNDSFTDMCKAPSIYLDALQLLQCFCKSSSMTPLLAPFLEPLTKYNCA